MHMNDLWFDVAIRGEQDLQDDVVARFHLSDGAELDANAVPPGLLLATLKSATGLRPVLAVDFF